MGDCHREEEKTEETGQRKVLSGGSDCCPLLPCSAILELAAVGIPKPIAVFF